MRFLIWVFLLTLCLTSVAGEGLPRTIAALAVAVTCLLYHGAYQDLKKLADRLKESNLMLFKQRGHSVTNQDNHKN